MRRSFQCREFVGGLIGVCEKIFSGRTNFSATVRAFDMVDGRSVVINILFSLFFYVVAATDSITDMRRVFGHGQVQSGQRR